MTTTTHRLASGKSARLVFGALAATALTTASFSPALARDHRERDGISAGEVIAGAVVFGGIAALAGAFDGDRDRWDYRGNRWDRGGRWGISSSKQRSQRENTGEDTGEGEWTEHGVQLVGGNRIAKKARGPSLSFAPG